jgi:hypothetical protein
LRVHCRLIAGAEGEGKKEGVRRQLWAAEFWRAVA